MRKFKITIILILIGLIFQEYSFVYPSSILSVGDFSEKEFFKKGITAFKEGFYSACSTIMQNFIQRYPDSLLISQANLYLIKSLFFQAKYEQAQEIFSNFNQEDLADPNSEEFFWRIKVLYSLGNYQEIVNILQRLEKQNNKNLPVGLGEIFINCCFAEYKLDLLVRLLDCFKQENNSTISELYHFIWEEAFRRKLWQVLEKTSKKYLALYPNASDRDYALFYLATVQLENNELDKAVISFGEGLTICSNQILKAKFYQGLLLTHLAQGKDNEAQNLLAKIEEKDLFLFLLGRYYEQKEDYYRSEKAYKDCINFYPQSYWAKLAKFYCADVLFRMGRISDALSLYLSFLENNQDSIVEQNLMANAQYRLGLCYQQLNDLVNAKKYFSLLLSSSSKDNWQSFYGLIEYGKLLWQEKEYEQLIELYNSFLDEVHDKRIIARTCLEFSNYLFQLGKVNFAEQILNRLDLNELSLENKDEYLYSQGIIKWLQGNFNQAAELFGSFWENFPNSSFHSQVGYWYINSLLKIGRVKEAAGFFTEYFKVYPDSQYIPLAFERITIAFCYNKLTNELEEFFNNHSKKLILKYSSKLNKMFQEDLHFLKENNLFQQLQLLGGILSKSEIYPLQFYSFIELASLAANREDYQQALQLINNVPFALQNYYLQAGLLKADILYNLGQKKEAIKVYNNLLTNFPDSQKEILTAKAYLFFKEGDYQQAKDNFKLLIDQFPDNISSQIVFDLAFCYEKTGDEKTALANYQKVIASNNNNLKLKAYFRMARIYEKSKLIKKARIIYQKIVSLNVPEAKIAKQRLEAIE